MINDLAQWAESTYQGCKDPTIGIDEEPIKVYHECCSCGHLEHKLKRTDKELYWCLHCFPKHVEFYLEHESQKFLDNLVIEDIEDYE